MSGLARAAWVPTRAAGLNRLATFVPHTGRYYAEQRNYDYGPDDRSNVSCLSPWLRHRLITEEEVLRATLEVHDPGAAQSFVQEVFWRTYFKGWMEHRPHVWSAFRDDAQMLAVQVASDAALRRDVDAAVSGATGIACFDGWVRELLETGYLHNHARMWFASIWIFTLRLPWQLGADFFLRHLLDGDPASNTLSWRWVGGLHTLGKTYLATADNITRFTGGRFGDADALARQLATDAMPLDDALDVDDVPLELPDVRRPEGRFGILIGEDDLHGVAPERPGMASAALAIDLSAARAVGEIGPTAGDFVAGAIRDTCDRLESDGGGAVAHAVTDNVGASVPAWARDHDLSAVVVAAPAVGHVRDALVPAQSALERSGIPLIHVHRAYDRTCWPHATRGFFKLRKKIPDLLRSLHLA